MAAEPVAAGIAKQSSFGALNECRTRAATLTPAQNAGIMAKQGSRTARLAMKAPRVPQRRTSGPTHGRTEFTQNLG